MHPRMKLQTIPLWAASLALLFAPSARSQDQRDNPLGQLLRGVAEALIQKQQRGKVQPLRPSNPYGKPDRVWQPRVFNVTDPDGNEGFIQQGQLFWVVGEGFGDREGQIALLPDGSDQWVVLNQRSIQRWSDDAVTCIIPDSPFGGRSSYVSVAVVTAEGRSDAMGGIQFRTTGGRPLPPIPGTRPSLPDYGRDRDRDRDRPPYAGQAPENTPWSVAAVEGDPNESPAAPFAGSTLDSLGPPPGRGTAASSSRRWAGATIGLVTIGTPSNTPWTHFVVGIAAGHPNAARIANTVAASGARGYALRATTSQPPPGGYPSLIVSGERLNRDQIYIQTLDERTDRQVDEQLLRNAFAIALPPEAGRLRLGTVDELGRMERGSVRSVVKCLSGEARHLTILAILSRTNEPYRRPDGRPGTRAARSLRIAVLSNGPRDEDACRHMQDSWR